MQTSSEPGDRERVIEGTSVALGSAGFELRNAGELWRVAGFIASSNLKPHGLQTQADCFLVMAYGQMYGYGAMEALQRLHVVKGRVCIGAEDMVAKIQAHPACVSYRLWVEGEGDARAGCVQSHRRGRPGANDVVRFTLTDARTAGLYDEKWRDRNGEPSVWVKYPADQLLWKAAARDYRRNWPDAYSYKLTPYEDLRELGAEREERVVRTVSAPPPAASPKLQALAAGTRPVEITRPAAPEREFVSRNSSSVAAPTLTLEVAPPPAAAEAPPAPDPGEPPLPDPAHAPLSRGMQDAITRRAQGLVPEHQPRARLELEQLVREKLAAGLPIAQAMGAVRDWRPRWG